MEFNFKEEHFINIPLRVNYNEATNFKEVMGVYVNDIQYAVYEQYCKNINCDCTGATVEMVKVGDGALDTSVVYSFDFDYAERKILKAYSELPEGFEEAILNDDVFHGVISNRSQFVKKAFEREQRRREILRISKIANSISSTKKTPRNAPCPCQSGRKYKNCCGK
jgi:hypothetical protein